MPRLSQETIAVIGVGVALGALILTTTGGLREEIQAVRAEAHADREASERRLEAFERRMAADREASERRMADFEKQIIRLTEQQGTLGDLVEGLRHRQLTATGSNDPPG